jgi:surface-anchored protein
VGIGAEELTPADWVDGEITITLTGMTGPSGAIFSLRQTSGGVPTFFMSTLDGISGADAYLMDLDVQDHAHFDWAFTAEGDYELTFEISGTHAVDGFKSAEGTYNFSVIPEPSSALLGAFGALALLRRRRN